MAEESFKRKLTSILSADVEGYSRLMGEDESATVKCLETYKGVMFSLIEQHRGRVVDSPGDNLLADFGSVVDAVQCAVAVQKELQARNASLPENRRMQFRIGINLGDVIEEQNRIYGDGVNIASRLEALAEAGGICVSKTAFDQIESKLPLGYEFLGDQTVKNIAKPIGAYRVVMEPRVTGRGKKEIERASEEKMAYPLPDKPSIAVLSFDNLSGDPEQEYISNGISENIIATLSKVSRIFVIARNSTFTYKGKPVKVQQVAEELGVRYVLEGSVQISGDQLRVTAQLIDAINGRHLWSERYDRKMRDFFDLQDEITKKIVVELEVELGFGEGARLVAKPTENFEAWTNVAKGFELFIKLNKEDNLKARALFEAAIKLDPGYTDAWQWLAQSHQWDARHGWSESRAASMKLAHEYIQKALALDDKSPHVHGTLGTIYLTQRQLEKAISEFKMAISLDPNFTPGYAMLANAMIFMGEFEESITLMKKAMRLSPYYAAWYLMYLGQAYRFTRRYEEAITTFNQLLDRCRNGELPTWWPLSGLAQVYAELGRVEEAKTFMVEVLEVNPKLSLDFYRRTNPFKDPAHLQRMLDALSKAGLK